MKPQDTASSGRSVWRLVGKTAVVAVLFTILLRRVELARCWDAVRRSDPAWMLAAFSVCSGGLFVSTLKWRGLLASMGVRCVYWRLIELYSIGHFVSSFLPGTVGGDVVRCRLLAPATDGYLKATASILIERLTGLVAMVTLAAVAVAVRPDTFATGPVLFLIASIAGGLVLGLAVALNRRLATVLAYRTRRTRLAGPFTFLHRLHRLLLRFPVTAILSALAWSFVFYLALGLMLLCTCRAFAVSLSFVEAVSVTVVVSLLALLPVSIGGLGLRQAGDVYLLGLLGVDPAKALVISLVMQTIGYAYALLGGPFLLLEKDQRAAAAANALRPRSLPTTSTAPAHPLRGSSR